MSKQNPGNDLNKALDGPDTKKGRTSTPLTPPKPEPKVTPTRPAESGGKKP